MSPFPSRAPRRRRFIALTILLFPLVTLFPLTPAAAQEAAQNAAPQTFALAPLVVSATRVPTPEADLGSSVTVITAADIARLQARTLVDVLETVPGLNVVQSGGPGETASVFIRGANANHTKVLIDGIDVSDPSSTDGSFDFAHILTGDIARIEILRGPQSGLYGSDAIGGVIDIITKKGKGPLHVSGSVEGGSFATFNQTAAARGATGPVSYAFDVAHFHAGDTDVTPSDLVPPGRSVNPDSYDNKTASTRLGLALSDTLDLGLVARYVDTALDFTADDLLGPESLRSLATTQQLFTRATAHQTLFDGLFEQTFGLGYTDYHRRYFDPNTAPPAPTDYHGDRVKFDWQGNLHLLAGETLVLGAEHQRDAIDDTTPVTAQMNNSAGYTELESQLGTHFFNAASIRFDENSRFGGKATYRLAPAILLPETGTKLKASLGTGFKAPTLDDLYDNYPAFDFYANPNLQPETSLGYDAGFEQAVFAKRVRFGATYFHNDIRNLIEINDTGTTLINVGRATTYGAESFVAYQVTRRLSLRGDYTYTIAQDAVLHEELLRRPRNKESLIATWQATDAVQLSTTVLRLGPWLDSNRAGTQSGVPVNGYTTVNLAGSYALPHGVTLFARIDNLLDRRYQEPLGYEHPGFGVFAGVRVAFDAAALAH